MPEPLLRVTRVDSRAGTSRPVTVVFLRCVGTFHTGFSSPRRGLLRCVG